MSDRIHQALTRAVEAAMVDVDRRSWGRQSREAKVRRFDYVKRMVLEAECIRQQNAAGASWCDWAAEAVIMGDLDMLRTCAETMKWDDEPPETGDKMAQRFAAFRQLCLDAHDSLEAEAQARTSGARAA